MLITLKQYDGLADYADKVVQTSWRTRLLIRKQQSRSWLAKTACEGIVAECNNVSTIGSPGLQDALRERVYDYVLEANTVKGSMGESGFVISTIILAAILSWLIQKLLDHLFSKTEAI